MSKRSRTHPRPSVIARWEALPARRQLVGSACLLFVVLAAVHVAFFQRITAWRSLAYAASEAVVIAVLVVFATQSELARRRLAEADIEAPPSGPHDRA